ncbi:MAG: PepSY-associated TM helix domain-containing protein [Chloroflexota bacterium]
MNINWNKFQRKFHFWGSLIIFIPILVVIASGVLLQLKGEAQWQPPSAKGVLGSGAEPTLNFEEILAVAMTVPEAKIQGWGDVDRLQVRIDKGATKVRSENRWEVQVDNQTGEVLHVGYRWVAVIEELHDGSWFHEKSKMWVFLPASMILLMLWTSGVYLFIAPYWSKWQRARTKRQRLQGAMS